MENKDLTTEEKLQRIVDLMSKEKADAINVDILKKIIGTYPAYPKNRSKSYLQGSANKVSQKNYEYKENYIS